MRKFRDSQPVRTYTGPKKNDYTKYHNLLAEDFNHRCGYTDCLDTWWGDGFNIDHFAPKKPKILDAEKLKKFDDLKNDYKNLVYSCPQVNRAKGADWASDDPSKAIVDGKGYLDPCVDFNEFFERSNSGGIMPKANPTAEYMWKKLKLYLIRYELYWRLEQLAQRKHRLHDFRRMLQLPEAIRLEVLTAIADLDEEFDKYWNYLRVDYRKLIR